MELLRSRDPEDGPTPGVSEINDLRDRLRVLVGAADSADYETIQQLIIAEWDRDRSMATMATLAFADPNSEIDYSALPKVLL